MNTNKQILDNAPDGATHYSWETYCKANKDFFYDWNGEYWCAYFVPDGDMRSLADIKALVAKDKRIAELEKDKEFLLSKRFMGNTIFTNQGLNDAIAEHNLIQQAKGIEDALGDYDVNLELLAGDKFYKKALTNRVRKLREQAKGGAS